MRISGVTERPVDTSWLKIEHGEEHGALSLLYSLSDTLSFQLVTVPNVDRVELVHEVLVPEMRLTITLLVVEYYQDRLPPQASQQGWEFKSRQYDLECQAFL